MKHFSPSLRNAITYTLILSFVVTGLPFPARAAETIAIDAKDANPLKNFNLPEALGAVDELRFSNANAKDSKFVFLIQDAHAIPDAQKSIQKIIQYLKDKYGVQWVGVEGAFSELDPILYRNFPDREGLEKVFAQYLNRGELSGASASAVLDSKEALYQGLEENKLYENEIAAFFEAESKQELLLAQIREFQKSLQALKQKYYSRILLEWDQKIHDFEQQKIDLAVFLQEVSLRGAKPSFVIPAKAGIHGSPLKACGDETSCQKKYPHLASILKQLEIEKTFLTEAPVIKEVEILSQSLRSRIKDHALVSQWNQKQQEYKTQQMSLSSWAVYLYELGRSLKLKPRLSAKLQSVIEFEQRLRAMKGGLVFDEIHAFVENQSSSLLENENQRGIHRLNEQLRLLEKFAILEMSRADWVKWRDSFVSHPEERSDEGSIDLNEIVKFEATLKLFSSNPAWQFSHRFYEVAEEREKIFMRRLTQKGKASEQKSKVLLVGGFHTAGLRDAFHQKGISYALITPSFRNLPEQNLYRDFMHGKVSWRKHFHPKNGRVHLYSAFARAVSEKLFEFLRKKYGPAESHRVARTWRDGVLTDLAKKNRLGEARQYTRFIDEGIVQGLPEEEKEKLKQEWFDRVDRFVKGLKDLKAQNQLTGTRIANLIQTPAAQHPYANGVLDREAEAFGLFQRAETRTLVLGRSEWVEEKTVPRMTEKIPARGLNRLAEFILDQDIKTIANEITNALTPTYVEFLRNMMYESNGVTSSDPFDRIAVRILNAWKAASRNPKISPSLLEERFIDALYIIFEEEIGYDITYGRLFDQIVTSVLFALFPVLVEREELLLEKKMTNGQSPRARAEARNRSVSIYREEGELKHKRLLHPVKVTIDGNEFLLAQDLSESQHYHVFDWSKSARSQFLRARIGAIEWSLGFKDFMTEDKRQELADKIENIPFRLMVEALQQEFERKGVNALKALLNETAKLSEEQIRSRFGNRNFQKVMAFIGFLAPELINKGRPAFYDEYSEILNQGEIEFYPTKRLNSQEKGAIVVSRKKGKEKIFLSLELSRWPNSRWGEEPHLKKVWSTVLGLNAEGWVENLENEHVFKANHRNEEFWDIGIPVEDEQGKPLSGVAYYRMIQAKTDIFTIRPGASYSRIQGILPELLQMLQGELGIRFLIQDEEGDVVQAPQILTPNFIAELLPKKGQAALKIQIQADPSNRPLDYQVALGAATVLKETLLISNPEVDEKDLLLSTGSNGLPKKARALVVFQSRAEVRSSVVEKYIVGQRGTDEKELTSFHFPGAPPLWKGSEEEKGILELIRTKEQTGHVESLDQTRQAFIAGFIRDRNPGVSLFREEHLKLLIEITKAMGGEKSYQDITTYPWEKGRLHSIQIKLIDLNGATSFRVSPQGQHYYLISEYRKEESEESGSLHIYLPKAFVENHFPLEDALNPHNAESHYLVVTQTVLYAILREVFQLSHQETVLILSHYNFYPKASDKTVLSDLHTAILKDTLDQIDQGDHAAKETFKQLMTSGRVTLPPHLEQALREDRGGLEEAEIDTLKRYYADLSAEFKREAEQLWKDRQKDKISRTPALNLNLFDEGMVQVFQAASIIKLDQYAPKILEKILAPERILEAHFSATMDNGRKETFYGNRIIFNTALGVPKGGIRNEDKKVSEEEARNETKMLAARMVGKFPLMGIPFGGAKGIALLNRNNKQYSLEELEKIMSAYVPAMHQEAKRQYEQAVQDENLALQALGPYAFGPYTDVPAPDLNTSVTLGENSARNRNLMDIVLEADLRYKAEPGALDLKSIEPSQDPTETPFADRYFENLEESPGDTSVELAAVTGKSVGRGGSLGRGDATGQGVFFTTLAVLNNMPEGTLEMLGFQTRNIQNKTVSIQGFGNVGASAAKAFANGTILVKGGARVNAVSDFWGTLENENGLDISDVEFFHDRMVYAFKEYIRQGGNPRDFDPRPSAEKIKIWDENTKYNPSPNRIFDVKSDIYISAYREHQIHKGNAEKIAQSKKLIIEGANNPTTPEADEILANAKVLVVPDILANAGGATVSYFEWLQNLKNEQWPEITVQQLLEEVMSNATERVLATARAYGVNYRTAANILSLKSVVNAEIARNREWSERFSQAEPPYIGYSESAHPNTIDEMRLLVKRNDDNGTLFKQFINRENERLNAEIAEIVDTVVTHKREGRRIRWILVGGPPTTGKTFVAQKIVEGLKRERYEAEYLYETQKPLSSMSRSPDDKIIVAEGSDVFADVNVGEHGVVPKEERYSVFVDTNPSFKLDGNVPLTASDMRLLAEILYRTKENQKTALKAIQDWRKAKQDVIYRIYPMRKYADVSINTFLGYELPLLRDALLKKLEEARLEAQTSKDTEALVVIDHFSELLNAIPAVDPRGMINGDSLLSQYLPNDDEKEASSALRSEARENINSRHSVYLTLAQNILDLAKSMNYTSEEFGFPQIVSPMRPTEWMESPIYDEYKRLVVFLEYVSQNFVNADYPLDPFERVKIDDDFRKNIADIINQINGIQFKEKLFGKVKDEWYRIYIQFYPHHMDRSESRTDASALKLQRLANRVLSYLVDQAALPSAIAEEVAVDSSSETGFKALVQAIETKKRGWTNPFIFHRSNLDAPFSPSVTTLSREDLHRFGLKPPSSADSKTRTAVILLRHLAFQDGALAAIGSIGETLGDSSRVGGVLAAPFDEKFVASAKLPKDYELISRNENEIESLISALLLEDPEITEINIIGSHKDNPISAALLKRGLDLKGVRIGFKVMNEKDLRNLSNPNVMTAMADLRDKVRAFSQSA